jgi:hypothetical protein
MAGSFDTRKLLVAGLGPVLAAFLYAGWVLYSRWSTDRQMEEVNRAKQVEYDRRFLNQYGSDAVKISFFYAKAGEIRRGTNALLCYGVLNAKAVTLDPPVEALHPAFSYCFNVTPAKTTTYTLNVEGRSGGKATQPVTVVVK